MVGIEFTTWVVGHNAKKRSVIARKEYDLRTGLECIKQDALYPVFMNLNELWFYEASLLWVYSYLYPFLDIYSACNS